MHLSRPLWDLLRWKCFTNYSNNLYKRERTLTSFHYLIFEKQIKMFIQGVPSHVTGGNMDCLKFIKESVHWLRFWDDSVASSKAIITLLVKGMPSDRSAEHVCLFPLHITTSCHKDLGWMLRAVGLVLLIHTHEYQELTGSITNSTQGN